MIINEEVKNLLDAGFMREVKYPEWFTNVVVVHKKNGKWRVCIDFTDFNKSYPEDPFPRPHINKLFDATAGHQLIRLMDDFSGYNQIIMHSKIKRKLLGSKMVISKSMVKDTISGKFFIKILILNTWKDLSETPKRPVV